MQAYADYTFYTDTYHGEMDEPDFERNALSASQYIRCLTHGQSDGYEGDELKYAACEAADILYASYQETADGAWGKKSENTDGYSVSYVTQVHFPSGSVNVLNSGKGRGDNRGTGKQENDGSNTEMAVANGTALCGSEARACLQMQRSQSLTVSRIKIQRSLYTFRTISQRSGSIPIRRLR